MESSPGQHVDFKEASGFIDALVKATQSYGVASRAVVVTLSRVVKALGLNGEFIATPNYVQTVLWGDDEHQQSIHLAVSRSGDFNLAKLAQVTRLTQEVEAGAVRPVEAVKRLSEIRRAPDAYGPKLTALAFMLCAASFAVVIGASWFDALFGGLAALASYGVTRLAARSAGVAALQELLAAVLAALLANAAASFFPRINPDTVTLCAIIWFVPGFGLTIAPGELIAGNTLSGIMWLTNAMIAALKLFGGTAIGVALARGAGFVPSTVSPVGDIAAAWRWVAVPVLVIAFVVLMKAEWRHLWFTLAGGWLVWAALQAGNGFGFWQGTFLGATALTIFANWCASRFRMPAAVVLLPCVMLLVPGRAALQALYVADTDGILAGFHAAYDVVILVAAITGGAIVGDALALHNLAKTGTAMKALIGWPGAHGAKEEAG